jgi:hypothetical protein
MADGEHAAPAQEASIVEAHFDEHQVSFRGHVDAIHGASGIEGWALDLARPTARLRLQCVVDREVLAECETDRPREDVRQLARCHGHAGFRLPPEIFSAAARLVETHGTRRIAIRIAGTAFHLPFSGPLPTVRDIAPFGLVSQSRQAARTAVPSSPVLGAVDGTHPATPLLAYPLRALSETLHGRIELTSKDVMGELWIGGWMKKGHPLSFPAVLHDGQKYPATVELTAYNRGDLPQGMIAVFGVVRSAWAPTARTEDLFLFFGDQGRFHLRWNKPLHYRSIDELLALFEEIRPRCFTGQTAIVQRAMSSVANWSPALARSVGFAADTHLDRMLVVPGFGVFAEGWVLSPVKAVETLLLRIGGAVLKLDPDSLYRKRRADLVSVFDGSDEFLDRRGFVAVFRGALAANLVDDPVLKVVFADGTSINHAVNARIIRRLGHSAGLGEVLPYYPNIQFEHFFGDFAMAVGPALRERLTLCRPYTVSAADRAILYALPNSRADIYLLFDQLRQRLEGKWQPPGLALILADNELRSDVIPLFEELARAFPCPISLFIVPSIDYALYALPSMLNAIGAVRFFYIGPDVVLADRGWRAAVQFLAQNKTVPLFFGIDDEPGTAVAREPTANCLGWTTVDFAAWVADAPTMVGGSHAATAVSVRDIRSEFRSGMAWRGRSPKHDRLATLVNQAVLRHRGLIAHDSP